MNILTQETAKLGGHIVGLGKLRSDGSLEYRETDIHNRITSAGLDHLLCFNGQTTGGCPTPSGTGLFLRCNSTDHYGIFTYMAFGTSAAQTGFEDTALRNQVGGYSSTKYPNSNTSAIYFRGTRKLSNGVLAHRYTWTSSPVTDPVTAKEIGIFGRYGNPATYVMFARISINESPVSLLAGESLVASYELVETRDTEVHHMDSFCGLTDAEGRPLQCDYRICPYYYTPDYYGIDIRSHYVTSSGFDERNVYPDNGMFGLDFSTLIRSDGPWYSTTDHEFPAFDQNNLNLSNFQSSTGDWGSSLLTYEGVGTLDKQRDIRIYSGNMNPGFIDYNDFIDIKYLRVRGMDYRFGYWNNDTWVSQSLRKFADQTLTVTHRVKYDTVDTIPEEEP